MDIPAAIALVLFLLFCVGLYRFTSPAAVEERWRGFADDLVADQLQAGRDIKVPPHPNCQCAVTYASPDNRVWLDEQVREVLDSIPDIDQL